MSPSRNSPANQKKGRVATPQFVLLPLSQQNWNLLIKEPILNRKITNNSRLKGEYEAPRSLRHVFGRRLWNKNGTMFVGRFLSSLFPNPCAVHLWHQASHLQKVLFKKHWDQKQWKPLLPNHKRIIQAPLHETCRLQTTKKIIQPRSPFHQLPYLRQIIEPCSCPVAWGCVICALKDGGSTAHNLNPKNPTKTNLYENTHYHNSCGFCFVP